jgi:hypothetical protein
MLMAVAAVVSPFSAYAQDASRDTAADADKSAATASDKQPVESELPFRRFSFGFSVRYWPFQAIDKRTVEVDTTNTGVSRNTTSRSTRFGLAPVFDANFSPRWTLRAETFFGHLGYTQITQNYTGGTVSTGTLKVTYTENTKVGYWDFPVVMRYHFLPKSAGSDSAATKSRLASPSILANFFVEGGGSVRHLLSVRTGNDTLNADATTAYNENPTAPAHHTIAGAVAGFGYRMIDDFNFKLIPEVRYTVWFAPTFNVQSTHSSTRQLEVNLSLVK